MERGTPLSNRQRCRRAAGGCAWQKDSNIMATSYPGFVGPLGWGAVSMLDSFPFSVAIGALLGVLAGLGTGGGSLLILWLTVVLEMDPAVSRSINLLFYIPSALISCIFRWKQGNFSLKKLLPAIISGCIFAGIFSWLSTMLNIQLLRKLFGLLLLFIGARELLYRPRNAK